jgi:SAM-dependent methyltransferase
MDLTTFEWLTTEPGQAALEVATRWFGDLDRSDLQRADELRLYLSAQPDSATETETATRAAAVLSQVELRHRAITKFGEDANRMYFTRDGLEQATRPRVADHRASRVSLTGLNSVIDLGCGIGGDLLAFAKAGLTAAGVDTDPTRVAIARANLQALGLPGAVTVADATQIDVTAFGVAFCDPARRSRKGRTFKVQDWAPSWDFVTELLANRAVIKTAPGIPHTVIPKQVEAEFVSEAGELKESSLWSPALATCARRATVIGHGGLATLTEDDDPWWGGQVPPCRELGSYLYEPDDAVIRAGLVTAVAAGIDGALLHPKIAYVTSEQAFATPFAKTYQVLEALPFREKGLKAALRARGIGKLTIKKRGIEVSPEALRKRLDLKGPEEGTLLLARTSENTVAVLVQPLPR